MIAPLIMIVFWLVAADGRAKPRSDPRLSRVFRTPHQSHQSLAVYRFLRAPDGLGHLSRAGSHPQVGRQDVQSSYSEHDRSSESARRRHGHLQLASRSLHLHVDEGIPTHHYYFLGTQPFLGVRENTLMHT